MALEDDVESVLKTPIGTRADDPSFGFEALERDGSTKLGFSEQVFADLARAALTRHIPGVVFNDITTHRDEAGQLMRVDIDLMDEIHDPSSRTVAVVY